MCGYVFVSLLPKDGDRSRAAGAGSAEDPVIPPPGLDAPFSPR